MSADWTVDTPWAELPLDVRRRIARFQNGDDDAMEERDEAWYRHGPWRVPVDFYWPPFC